MAKKVKLLPRVLGLVLMIPIILAFTLMVVNATEGDKVYDFEDGTLMGWKEAWGGSLGSTTLSCSSDLATTGNKYSMRLDVAYTGAGWEQTDVAVFPSGTDWVNYDFSNCVSLDYDLFVPMAFNSGSLSVKAALNGGDGWYELGGHYGNVIADQSKVTINGVEYAKLHFTDPLNGTLVAATRAQVVLELAGQNTTYSGPIYVDNVNLVASHPVDNTIVKAYNFEDSTVMGWKEAWGGALGSVSGLSCSNDLAVSGNTYTLRLNAAYTGGGWEQSDIGVWLSGTDYTNFDLSNCISLEYDILVPTTFNGTLSIKTALNGGSGWYELAGHYGNVIASQSKVTINGVEYAKMHFSDPLNGATVGATRGQLVLELAGQGSTYNGPIYIDNVALLSSGAVVAPTPTPIPPPEFVADVFPPPVEGQDFVYDFELSKMSWWKGWGGAFDTTGGMAPVEYSADLQQPGNNGSLQVNLKYTGGSWEEANISVWLKNQTDTKFDLTGYEAIEYDIYMPNPGQWSGGLFKMATCLNNNWVVVKDLVDYRVSDLPTVDVNGVTYAKIHRYDELGDITKNDSGQLVIRLASWNLKYQGPLYVDDIKLVTPKTFKIYPAGLATDDVLTGTVKVTVKTVVPSGEVVSAVNLTSASGRVTPMTLGSGGIYECNWDTTKEKDGFQTVSISGVTVSGATDTKQIEVYLKNTATTIEFVQPQFESVISGRYIVKANVTNSRGVAIKDVDLIAGKLKLPMLRIGGSYVTMLLTQLVDDGAQSLVIKAKDAEGYTVEKYIDVIVDNDKLMNSIVKRSGKEFVINGKPFYYVGFNDYSLPFKYDLTLPGNEKAAAYTNNNLLMIDLLPKGTVLDFKQQVDRTMLEAGKLGMTVLRTWAFNATPGDAHAFINTGDWSFNESQFKRLDYVMDSARRHGIRVMLALENYWNDYGGIKATTDKLGLYKLEFFTNPNAKQMYKDYAAHLINRTNTVNGLKYSADPTLFSWDLMNEPRMGRWEDDSPGQTLWDRDGSQMSAWINEMSSYIKSLDPNHMVSAGAEAQGFTFESEGVTYVWGDTYQGYVNDPLRILDQPNIDFFTIHPYPNSVWFNYSLVTAQSMITNYVKEGHRRNKPVVMQEWGISHDPLRDPNNDNVSVPVTDPSWQQLKELWFKGLLQAFRKAGGNGSNVWMIQIGSQEVSGHTVGLYYPFWKAQADRTLAEIISNEADWAAKISGRKGKGHECK
ncbi:MAG TPA: hypothetical protein VHY08_21825 [Bacillota bacterium]|nr:hypothetical protein [Bacillota bacterium]